MFIALFAVSSFSWYFVYFFWMFEISTAISPKIRALIKDKVRRPKMQKSFSDLFTGPISLAPSMSNAVYREIKNYLMKVVWSSKRSESE